MWKTILKKLGLCTSLVVGLALPSMANTLPSHDFNPDRDTRNHRESSDDVTNPSANSGDSLFRPGRHNSFQSDDNNDNDDVVLPPTTNDLSGPLAENPLVPDAPADQVPEPGTIMLVAPAVIGLFKKFRR
jgi:hypothetical protein